MFAIIPADTTKARMCNLYTHTKLVSEIKCLDTAVYATMSMEAYSLALGDIL